VQTAGLKIVSAAAQIIALVRPPSLSMFAYALQVLLHFFVDEFCIKGSTVSRLDCDQNCNNHSHSRDSA
jgi:hypothetical protein